MRKRGQVSIKFTSVFEILLIVMFTVAIAFVINGGLVSGVGVQMTTGGLDGNGGGGIPEAASVSAAANVAPSPALTGTQTYNNRFDQVKSATGSGASVAKIDASKPTAPPKAGSGGIISEILGGSALGGHLLGHLVSGLAWGGIAAAAVEFIGPMFGLSKQNTNALAVAGLAGVGIARFGFLQAPKTGLLKTLFGTEQAAFVTGIAITAVIFILMYKKTTTKTVTFQCLPYQPPVGGQKCSLCNSDPLQPCSEYRCRSLGQACQIVNKGTTDQKCVWVNPDDVTPPVITPDLSALSPLGLKYTPDKAISPPARGVKIVTANGGCLPAFTKLQFGLTTNEPAQCKIDYQRGLNYSNMQYFFGETNYFLKNHTEIMKLPSPNSFNGTSNGSNGGSPILQSDGTFNLYVKCMDANGNTQANSADYVFNFCVDKSPDTTPPLIDGTSIPSGNPVKYGVDNLSIDVYTNEPADCKWSKQDKAYSDMENSMSCDSNPADLNANLEYNCTGMLNGIQNRINNTFYFRCKDQPGAAENKRNVDVQSYKLTLRGTEPLTITSVGPNGTIAGGTDSVPVNLAVTTANGADEGKAACYFSPTGNDGSYVLMFNTASYQSSQPLSLSNGKYTYYIKCIDAGGNAVSTNTTFNVYVDKQAPTVTRVYKDIDSLKVVTDENSECVYSLNSCDYNFDEGLKMIHSSESLEKASYVKWAANTNYYIKCEDSQGNQPAPNQCSVVVKATDFGGDTSSTN